MTRATCDLFNNHSHLEITFPFINPQIYLLEYDGSPRRFGMSSNEDVESHPKINSVHASNIPAYSSPSPPRPGFPKRVVSHDQPRPKSPPNPILPIEDEKIVSAYSSSSNLIPTTFINSNVCHSFSQDQRNSFIHSDADQNEVQNKASVNNEVLDKMYESCKPQFESSYMEGPSSFQVTSPTEEHVPTSTFDYLYEFSETRKVLEEFFKSPDTDKIKELEKFSDFNESDDSLVSHDNISQRFFY